VAHPKPISKPTGLADPDGSLAPVVRKGYLPMIEGLREEQRKEAFRMLVQLQDEGTAAEQSRVAVAAQFSINVRDVQIVEREGITKQWPPL
jgi:hypothetical protein